MAITPRRKPSRKGSMADMPKDVLDQLKTLEELFTVDQEKLKQIVEHFIKELQKGLSVEGGNIPMNVTWVLGFPTGHEKGTFLALDMGGTNLRVCEIELSEEKGEFDVTQSKYRIPEELKSGESSELWEYIADCVQQFIEYYHDGCTALPDLPLGFTFSYPATQEYVDHGVLQRWTKGFDIDGVEGKDVVPMLEEALAKKVKNSALSPFFFGYMVLITLQGLPIKVAALVNDTTGTLIASAYTDPEMKIGCIFGTGVNAAYMENAGSIPKIAHYNLPPDTPVAINCEYGAFDNELIVLPRTQYDDVSQLRKPYSLDSSFLAFIEEDPFENLSETRDLFERTLGIYALPSELEFCRRLAELIGTRAARLSACGVAAICKKKNITHCHVGADGSVFEKYPHFKARGARALREILDWPDSEPDRVVMSGAEDGSGVGAALIAALTLERVKQASWEWKYIGSGLS
ncbi:hexokinase [Histoplasma mississippiense (nom. inval.)]|uniref:hexokinase n=1 Tax=Ajellomyces capsulatus (strain NAm1 / WU24) TaxID=2059318 RepID=UPI000157BE48|nr:hexokinase [Histoplasma mississippiense (nom. inval.)]EDN07130.1 hexokinase [Histoplasma mississippiense (nom. inval.)]